MKEHKIIELVVKKRNGNTIIVEKSFLLDNVSDLLIRNSIQNETEAIDISIASIRKARELHQKNEKEVQDKKMRK